ncbi:hypothetical protein DJ031_00175 [bacterium endosymbiont of Escarpia laminata]|nr:MAG: hypothetical protein DJ031_00175 [bacterium endosymbiont of Escarpia laminata]
MIEYLLQGFTSGFSIGCIGLPPQLNVGMRNLKSADEFPGVIDHKLSKELGLGRVLGPFEVPPPLRNYIISPLGVVPKKAAGEFRMIHHLSYPEGSSVNDFIPKEFSSVRYATIYDAIEFIKHSPRLVYMAKVDIESAFRIIPIAPADRPLLGFRWRGQFFMDAVLPMGCSSSCSIFERFSTALEWAAKVKLGVTEVIHVIDDFLLLANSFEKCNDDMQAFISMCDQIGVPLAHEKTCGPSTSISFLGIIIDTVQMHARLPEDKLNKARTLLLSFLAKQKVTLKELQSLIGVLSFASEVVVPGRPFLRRLIDQTLGVSRPHYHIRLTRQTKLDLGVWLEFLQHFNGKAFFLDENFLTGDFLQLHTDAAGGIGYGALYGTEWFCGLWPVAWRSHNVAVLELYPIVAAVHVWGNAWENKSVCFFTDNEALVPIINNQTSREPHIMALIRPLVLACLRFNINFAARHIPGRFNILADKLSRSQVGDFHELAPWANTSPVDIPYSVSPAGLGSL